MSNFASYSTHVPSEETQEVYRPPVVRDTEGVTSVVIRDGAMSASTNTTSSVSSSDLTPYAEEDWRSGARKPNGFPATEITPDTIVKLGGMEGRVGDFASAGVLVKQPDGSYEIAGADADAGASESDPSDNPDAAVFPDEVSDVIDAAAEPFPQYAYDTSVIQAMHAAATDGDLAGAIRNLAKGSGLDPKDVEQRVGFIYSQYETQASRYVAKNGLHESDLQNFYEFCRENRQEFLQTIQRHMYQQDLSGYKGLISKFQNSTSPSLQVLQENGFQTRTHDREGQVRVSGVWMSVKAAARAGFI